MYRPLRKFQYEPQSSEPSITELTQSMSLKDMIERAERGVLDLRMFNKEQDFVSDTSDPDSVSEDDFSGNDRFFGQDLESAENEFEQQFTRAKRKKSSTQAKPREDSEHSKESEDTSEDDKR